MKICSHRTVDREGHYRGYGLFRDVFSEHDVEWLRINLPGPGDWFYSWDEGVVNRVLYFRCEEDRTLFLIACGTSR